jgi:hypothetical protein
LVHAKTQEELEVVFVGALYYTGLTVLGNGLTGASCEAQYVTGLTDHHHRSDRWTLAAQVFREEKFKLVTTPIHPLQTTSRSFQESN